LTLARLKQTRLIWIFSLLMTQNNYPNNVQLYGTMTTFGTYRLSYEPPAGSTEANIDMSISAEANLSDMLSFFGDFLRAATYPLDQDHELSIERKAPDFGNTQDFWEDDGVSWVGNPWAATMSNDSLNVGTTYIGSALWGGMGEDHLSFNPNFSSNVVTFS